jgi:hypothetical protein
MRLQKEEDSQHRSHIVVLGISIEVEDSALGTLEESLLKGGFHVSGP